MKKKKEIINLKTKKPPHLTQTNTSIKHIFVIFNLKLKF
jgi:hypothetical protein